MGPSKESLSLLYKAFPRPLLTYASSGRFPFLSITKLERLHRAASRAVTGCLSSSPIPLLLSEASLPPLRVTLTHFTLSSYERALCLPTSFPISSLARLGVKPRLYRLSWKAFACTHPLMLPSSPREALVACPFFPPRNLPSFTVGSALPTPCSCSDPPLSRQGAAYLESLPPHYLVLWTDGFFPFGKGGSGLPSLSGIYRIYSRISRVFYSRFVKKNRWVDLYARNLPKTVFSLYSRVKNDRFVAQYSMRETTVVCLGGSINVCH